MLLVGLFIEKELELINQISIIGEIWKILNNWIFDAKIKFNLDFFFIEGILKILSLSQLVYYANWEQLST